MSERKHSQDGVEYSVETEFGDEGVLITLNVTGVNMQKIYRGWTMFIRKEDYENNKEG